MVGIIWLLINLREHSVTFTTENRDFASVLQPLRKHAELLKNTSMRRLSITHNKPKHLRLKMSFNVDSLIRW